MTDSAVAALPLDLFTPEAMADPLPLLHRIRTETPIGHIAQLDAYLLTRHADITAALKDRSLAPANMAQTLSTFSQAEQDELLPLRESMERWMGHTVEADHIKFQQLLKRYFTPATVNGLRPRVRELTDELLDAVADRGRMDVVADLAYPLPANVIAEMLGMPTEERDRLRAWSRDIASIFHLADVDQLRQSQRSVLEMQEYLRGLVRQRRTEPRDDLISMFVAAEREGAVNEDEIVANCVLLLFAGHETTAGLIANGLVLLFQNPDELARLKADPELTPGAVEEMLRCDGPVPVVVRESTVPFRLNGTDLPAGKRFYLAMMAGNRDPEVFTDPDRFDITRRPNRHTAFGLGAFYCLGAALARVEADECFRILLDRCPDIRPGYDVLDRVPELPFGHRLLSLHVEF